MHLTVLHTENSFLAPHCNTFQGIHEISIQEKFTSSPSATPLARVFIPRKLVYQLESVNWLRYLGCHQVVAQREQTPSAGQGHIWVHDSSVPTLPWYRGEREAKRQARGIK